MHGNGKSLLVSQESLVFHWYVVSYAICDIWDPTNAKYPEVLRA